MVLMSHAHYKIDWGKIMALRFCCMLFCGCLLPVLAASGHFEHVIYVSNGTEGENSPECLVAGNASNPCWSLDWVLQQEKARLNSTNFILFAGTHMLANASAPFEKLANLAFTGSDSVVWCIRPEAGLAFLNVTDISLSSISLFYCGAVRNSTSKDFLKDTVRKVRVGLYFSMCKSISMTNVEVSHSPSATGVVMYNTDGHNSFTSCKFSNNTFDTMGETDDSVSGGGTKYPGGGGVYVEFSYCSPGEVCTSPLNKGNTDASYTFALCNFTRNQASNFDTDDRSTYIIPYGSDHEAFGRGGGLSIFVKGQAHNISITIVNNSFVSNTALWGGGMFVEFHDGTYDNSIWITNTSFTNNSCPYSIYEGTEGGGLRIGHYVYNRDSSVPEGALGNDIIVETCSFINNSALNGGGISISPSLQRSPEESIATVHLLVNYFEGNVAKLGSALNVDKFGDILEGLMMNVWIVACTFYNNSNNYAQHIGKGNEPYQLGLGTVHADAVSVWFKYFVVFDSNDGSAFGATSTIVKFAGCNATFRNNHGNNGGGIALHGGGTIVISNTTSFLFQNNTAVVRGGAIYNAYIERENLKSDSNCFIHHVDPFLRQEDWRATFTFIDNMDRSGSAVNAIHSTSILPCSAPGGSGVLYEVKDIFCWNGWTYMHKGVVKNCTAMVSSSIGNLTYKNGITTEAYPGWRFDMPVLLADDLGKEIKGQSFTVTYGDTKIITVAPKESVLVSGEPNTSITITMENFGDRIWHFDLVVELKQCPPGFTPNMTSSGYVQCLCVPNLFGGSILCDETSMKIQLLSGMWLGKLDPNETDYYIMDCPLNYCKAETKKRYRDFLYTLNKAIDFDEEICGNTNRKGINCGECIEGHGPAINLPSFDCINCTDINLAANVAKYIASAYLPLAFLFAVLIVFDIRLTTGPANAFILYCQVVSSTFDLNADGGVPHSTTMLSAYRFPFGISNLEFVEDLISPICFSEHFTTLSIFLLHYAVALIPLFMIVVVLGCLKVSERCCLKNQYMSLQHKRIFISFSRLASLLSRNKKKNINDAILPAFASFLLLSYTKFSTISSYILNTQHPIDENGMPISPPRVYYASQYSADDKDYLFYKIPAVVIFSTFVIFLPLVLLEYPLKALEWVTFRVKCLRKMYPADKVHLFLNMFQACYRDNMRFFAGLYFLFRFCINLSYIVTDTWLQQFLVQQAATTIMIALLAICQPYEKKILNYVDVLIFTNLAMLNSISFYLFSFTKIDPSLDPPSIALGLQYVLVFLPPLYMLCYVIWNVTRRYHPSWNKMCKNATKKLKKALKRNTYDPLAGSSDSDDELIASHRIIGRPPRSYADRDKEFESDFDAMLSRAEEENTYMPSVTVSKSMTLIEVSGRFGEGEAKVTRISEDSGLRSSQPSPGSPGLAHVPNNIIN